MRSLLRRTAPDKAMKLHVGDLALDTQTHIAERWGREIELTSKEYSLLEYLMRNKNKIISRAMIATHVWKTELDADSNIIDVYVKRLRTKIERQGSPRLLFSVRGVGYRIKEPSGLSEDHDDLETTTRRRTYVAGQREVEPSRRIVLRRPSIRREVIDEEDDD